MLSRPRFRLVTLLYLIVIIALSVTVRQQRRELRKTAVLMPKDVIVLDVPGFFPKFSEDARTYIVRDANGERSAVGYPTSIAADGTLLIPFLGKFNVSGLSLSEFQRLVAEACNAAGKANLPSDIKIAIVEKRISTLVSQDQ